MNEWVLVLWLLLGDNNSMIAIPGYSTLERCKIAGETFTQSTPKIAFSQERLGRFRCIPKG